MEITDAMVKNALRMANRTTQNRLTNREELRLAQLRAYTFAIASSLEDHVDMKALTKEELVAVLVAAALYITSKESGNDKAGAAAGKREGAKEAGETTEGVG